MNDPEFLNWVADRFVNVIGESPNVDFVHRLRLLSQQLEFCYETLKQLDKEDWRCLHCGVKGYHSKLCFVPRMLNESL